METLFLIVAIISAGNFIIWTINKIKEEINEPPVDIIVLIGDILIKLILHILVVIGIIALLTSAIGVLQHIHISFY